jgi:small-conductance mechanosensitive channel
MNPQVELLWWAAALIVGVPLAVVLFGEIASRLQARDSAYVASFELIRTVAVPSVTVFLIARRVLTLGDTHLVTRIAMTLMLISLAYVGFLLLQLIGKEKRQDRWENKVPSLFKIMLRIAVVVVPLILLFDTWGIDLTSNLSALGIGGIAIAFALQDAIGNIVSGIFLVLDRPFTVGDWVEVDGVHGEVVDISWRSTRLRVDADIIILPNTTLAGTSIRNLTAVDRSHDSFIDFSFGSDDRPTKVKAMLLEVAADNPSVSTAAAPEVHTMAFGDSAISYRLHYKLDNYPGDVGALRVQDQLRSAVFYAHARHGLSMPYPIHVQLDERALEVASPSPNDIQTFLSVNPIFSMLPTDVVRRIASDARPQVYTAEETILTAHRNNDELHIIRSGEVLMRPLSGSGDRLAASHTLGPGQIVGEAALVSSSAGVHDVLAATDVEVYSIAVALVRAVVEQHGRFAAAMNQLMRDRTGHMAAAGVAENDVSLPTIDLTVGRLANGEPKQPG